MEEEDEPDVDSDGFEIVKPKRRYKKNWFYIYNRYIFKHRQNILKFFFQLIQIQFIK